MPTPLNDRTCRRYLPDDPPDEPPDEDEDEDGNPLPRYEPDPPDDERRGGRMRWEP
jgi:hypothetical protein